MKRLTWMLAAVLRRAAGWLPPGRREWAEAAWAEADQVPEGWPRIVAGSEGGNQDDGGQGRVPARGRDGRRGLGGVAELAHLSGSGRSGRDRPGPGPGGGGLECRAAVGGPKARLVRPGPWQHAGAIGGLAAGGAGALPVYAAGGNDNYDVLLILGILILTFLLAGLGGVVAAWGLSGTREPQELREARIRQGLLAGLVAGGACGMLLTNLFVVAVFMMVLGPLVGVLGGATGGAIAADHPRRSRPDRSWSGGLFVSQW